MCFDNLNRHVDKLPLKYIEWFNSTANSSEALSENCAF